MAKCIRIKGVPVRTSDDDALRASTELGGTYCSKSFWKEWHISPAVGIPDKRPLARFYGKTLDMVDTLATHP
jgi:hypothetical protein